MTTYQAYTRASHLLGSYKPNPRVLYEDSLSALMRKASQVFGSECKHVEIVIADQAGDIVQARFIGEGVWRPYV